jgi:hypothetical protein
LREAWRTTIEMCKLQNALVCQLPLLGPTPTTEVGNVVVGFNQHQVEICLLAVTNPARFDFDTLSIPLNLFAADSFLDSFHFMSSSWVMRLVATDFFMSLC